MYLGLELRGEAEAGVLAEAVCFSVLWRCGPRENSRGRLQPESSQGPRASCLENPPAVQWRGRSLQRREEK